MLSNKEGHKIPHVTFKTRKNGQFTDLSTDQIFKGKTVVVFALPGAFTPTCSSAHLPRYNELAPIFKQNGIDDIVCISVNDAFVMDAWKADQEAENITVIPDGNADFTKGMDMLVDKSDLGFGQRSWRYSMLVKNGVITKQFIEADLPGDPFEVSDADTMLNYINPQATLPKATTIITKPGCPYCAKTKKLLTENNISYDEVSIGKQNTMRSVRALTGQNTVPQIFIEGMLIGDSVALEEYLLIKTAA